MGLEKLNIQKLTYLLIFVTLICFILIIGKVIFTPLAFGLLFAFLFYPFCNFFERKGLNRVISIALIFLAFTLAMGSVITLFSTQLVSVISDLSSLEKKMNLVLASGQDWLQTQFNITEDTSRDWIKDNVSNLMTAPVNFIAQGLKSSTTFIANLILTTIYTFLFLLYRSAIKNFFLTQFAEENRSNAENIIKQIQQIVQKYLIGIGIVMVILGLVESLALLIIGIDYPFFWGFLAAFLTIIPYVGTFIGAFLPFVYALVYSGTIWQPVAVVLLFVVVQQIEGNLITPKIVGANIKVNPLAAIISMIVGGFIWGIAGLILALPFLAILKIILDNVEPLKPAGFLLSSEIYEKENVFFKKYNERAYRIFRFFTRK